MEYRNALFFENVFPCLAKAETSAPKLVEHNEFSHEEELEEAKEPRRSKRARVENSFRDDFYTYMVEKEPQTFKEAVTSSEGPQ